MTDCFLSIAFLQYLILWQPFLHHSLVHSQHVPSSAVESPLPRREKIPYQSHKHSKNIAGVFTHIQAITVWKRLLPCLTSLSIFVLLTEIFYYKWQTKAWKWWAVNVHAPGSDSTRQRSISPSFPLALLLLSSHSRHAHLCSKYLTCSRLRLANRKITHTENPGWLCCWSQEKKSGTAEIRCLLNRLYSSDVFKQRHREKKMLTSVFTKG